MPCIYPIFSAIVLAAFFSTSGLFLYIPVTIPSTGDCIRFNLLRNSWLTTPRSSPIATRVVVFRSFSCISSRSFRNWAFSMARADWLARLVSTLRSSAVYISPERLLPKTRKPNKASSIKLGISISALSRFIVSIISLMNMSRRSA